MIQLFLKEEQETAGSKARGKEEEATVNKERREQRNMEDKENSKNISERRRKNQKVKRKQTRNKMKEANENAAY